MYSHEDQTQENHWYWILRPAVFHGRPCHFELSLDSAAQDPTPSGKHTSRPEYACQMRLAPPALRFCTLAFCFEHPKKTAPGAVFLYPRYYSQNMQGVIAGGKTSPGLCYAG